MHQTVFYLIRNNFDNIKFFKTFFGKPSFLENVLQALGKLHGGRFCLLITLELQRKNRLAFSVICHSESNEIEQFKYKNSRIMRDFKNEFKKPTCLVNLTSPQAVFQENSYTQNQNSECTANSKTKCGLILNHYTSLKILLK